MILTLIKETFLKDGASIEYNLANGIYLFFNSHIFSCQVTIISIDTDINYCNICNVFMPENDISKTKISYNQETKKVTFDSSGAMCLGQLFKLSNIIPNK